MSPNPAGPSNIAIAFVRMMPMTMVKADDAPIIAEDFRIWP
jgi:hypothetical protein